MNPLEKQSRFAFCFKLVRLENYGKYLVEFAYRNAYIPREFRNFLHAQWEGPSKKTLYEDSYNLSFQWEVLAGVYGQELPFPKQIYIGLFNQCDLTCPHCPWFSKTHNTSHVTHYFQHKQQLPTDTVHAILDFAAINDSKIVFSGPGEPLLDVRILDFIQYARNIGISEIEVATNGKALSLDIFKQLLDLRVRFVYSLCFCFEMYNEPIEKFQIQMLRNAQYYKSYGGDKHVIFSIFYEKKSFLEAFNFFMCIKKEIPEVKLSCYDPLQRYWEQDFSYIKGRHICAELLGSLYVFPSGDVGACEWQRGFLGRVLVEHLTFGNLYEKSLWEIWQGEKRKAFIEKHIRGLSCGDFGGSVCQTCGSWWNEI